MLLEFPCELVSAVVAGRWAASRSPFAPWMAGYQLRAVMAGVVTAIVRTPLGNLYWHPQTHFEWTAMLCMYHR